MKKSTVALVFGLLLAQISWLHAQAAVGTVAPGRSYASFDLAGALTDAAIYDHAGDVVVLYYYTPW